MWVEQIGLTKMMIDIPANECFAFEFLGFPKCTGFETLKSLWSRKPVLFVLSVLDMPSVSGGDVLL